MNAWSPTERWPFAAALLFSLIHLISYADKGWIPHDEGLLGQSAVRVLQGEWPHIDFDDPYTGLQAFWHATVMQLLGERSLSLRWAIVGAMLIVTALAYGIARHCVRPWMASVVAVTCMAWTTPNYFAAMPSWYNLLFSLIGTWLLIRYQHSATKASEGKAWYLWCVGLTTGVSVLFKVTGVYFLAAALLFLVYREQGGKHHQERQQASPGYRVFVIACLSCFVLVLSLLVRRRLTLMDGIHFWLPGTVLAITIGCLDARLTSASSRNRFRALFRLLLPLLSGFCIPVLLFMAAYASRNALPALFHGVVVLPQRRFEWAGFDLPSVHSLRAALPGLLLMSLGWWSQWLGDSRKLLNSLGLITPAGLIGLLLLGVAGQESIYRLAWDGLRPLVPVSVILGCVYLIKGPRLLRARRGQTVFLLISVSAMTSLIQFPYSAGVYFCYAAPLVFLAALAVARGSAATPGRLQFFGFVFLLMFALVWTNRGHVRRLGTQYVPVSNQWSLDTARLGLLTTESQASLYSDVVAKVRSLSDDNEAIYASTDCPEISYLAGRRNPTRTFYDFFEDDFLDPERRHPRIESLLREERIRVVVLHWQGEFSGGIDFELAGKIAATFPNVEHFSRVENGRRSEPVFSVAWRNSIESTSEAERD
ncbi:MAG: glycosyltransferase family 39 protein [Planctomycetota bacterium]